MHSYDIVVFLLSLLPLGSYLQKRLKVSGLLALFECACFTVFGRFLLFSWQPSNCYVVALLELLIVMLRHEGGMVVNVSPTV